MESDPAEKGRSREGKKKKKKREKVSGNFGGLKNDVDKKGLQLLKGAKRLKFEILVKQGI